MKFEKHHEALKWFRQYKPYDGKYIDWQGGKVNFGDWILFQHIDYDDRTKTRSISRPILGLCVGFSCWDMALVLNIVEETRAWMNFHKVLTNPDPKHLHYMTISSLDPEVESFPIWDDCIHEIAHWSHRPNFKELKEALSKNKI